MSVLQKTPFSILELATVGKDLGPGEALRDTLKVAQKAEEFGYSRFWLAEHHNMVSIASSATAVLIGQVAAATNTIRVGSGGIMLPNHSPLIVAEQFGTLGHLFPNRIDLGLGRAPGTDQVTANAIRSDRMQAQHHFPHEIERIQQYFSTDNENAAVRATVAEGVDVPIWVLGSSTDSAHLAAAKGLPYAFASHFSSAQLFDALNIYYNEFQPSKYLDKPKAMACINVIIADTEEEAERLYASLVKRFLGIITNQRDYMEPAQEMTADLKELTQHPSFQRMLKYTFVGTKEQVKIQTEEFIDATKVDELMVVSHMYSTEDRIKSIRLFSEIMKGE